MSTHQQMYPLHTNTIRCSRTTHHPLSQATISSNITCHTFKNLVGQLGLEVLKHLEGQNHGKFMQQLHSLVKHHHRSMQLVTNQQ